MTRLCGTDEKFHCLFLSFFLFTFALSRRRGFSHKAVEIRQKVPFRRFPRSLVKLLSRYDFFWQVNNVHIYLLRYDTRRRLLMLGSSKVVDGIEFGRFVSK